MSIADMVAGSIYLRDQVAIVPSGTATYPDYRVSFYQFYFADQHQRSELPFMNDHARRKIFHHKFAILCRELGTKNIRVCNIILACAELLLCRSYLEMTSFF